MWLHHLQHMGPILLEGLSPSKRAGRRRSREVCTEEDFKARPASGLLNSSQTFLFLEFSHRFTLLVISQQFPAYVYSSSRIDSWTASGSLLPKLIPQWTSYSYRCSVRCLSVFVRIPFCFFLLRLRGMSISGTWGFFFSILFKNWLSYCGLLFFHVNIGMCLFNSKKFTYHFYWNAIIFIS